MSIYYVTCFFCLYLYHLLSIYFVLLFYFSSFKFMKFRFNVRVFSQIAVLIIIFVLAFLHQNYGIESAAPIHAYCPFGALEGMFTYIFTGQFIMKLYRSNVILLWIFVLLTIIFGRVFCGYFCPLWAISERLRWLGRKLWIKKDIELPVWLDTYLRYLKYLILIVVIYFSFRYTALVFDTYDPFSALTHLGNEFDELIFAYSVLGFVLITSLFSKGRWCRYLCPLWAFFALLNKISFFKLTRNQTTCTACWSCNRVCPANLKIKESVQITHPDCISCMECVTDCPHSSLGIHILWKSIKKRTFMWLVVGLFFWILLVFIQTPLWKTKPNSNIVSSSWVVHVEGIRWSNTLQYIIKETWVPFRYFQETLNLPQDIDQTMKLKDIWITYDLKNISWTVLETEDFRVVIQNYITQ